MRRVAITGIGALTPIGTARDGLWDGLRRQRSAIRPLSRFDPSIYHSQIAGEALQHSDIARPRRQTDLGDGLGRKPMGRLVGGFVQAVQLARRGQQPMVAGVDHRLPGQAGR